MAQDPIRAQKAERWDALVASGVSPDEATQRVEAEFRAAAPATQRAAAPRTSSAADLSLAEEAKGLGRSLAQGLTFGFGEELESLPYLLPGGETQTQALQRIRGELGTYRKARPVVSMAAEFAGGMAPGAMLAKGAMAGARGATAAMRRMAQGAVAQGALGGAGAAEGGVKERAMGAAAGGVIGGALGFAGGKAAQAIGTRMARGGPMRPTVGMLEEAMEAGRMTPANLQTRATQLAQAAPSEARVMDVLGEPGVRIARRIEALGGEGGETVASTMRERVAGRPERLQAALTRTTGRGPENIIQTLDESIERGRAAADPLYEAFYAQKPKSSGVLDELLRTPFGQEVVARARRNAANARRRFIDPEVLADPEQGIAGQMARYHPQAVDDIKKAMDDLIYETRFAAVAPGQGGIRPGEKRAAKALRAEWVQEADALFPEYAPARAVWAGEKALRDAMDEGLDVALKKTDPRTIAKTIADMEPSELDYFQRGYFDGLRQKIDDGRLKPALLRTPTFRKTMEAVYGRDTDAVVDALLTDVGLVESANKIISGSRTAPLAADMAAELGQSRLGRFAQVARNVRSDPLLAGAQGLDYLANLRNAPRRALERGEKAEALMRPAVQIGPLLRQVEEEYAARQAGRQTGRLIGGVTAAQTSRTLMDYLTNQR